jgi:hypothetical protein
LIFLGDTSVHGRKKLATHIRKPLVSQRSPTFGARKIVRNGGNATPQKQKSMHKDKKLSKQKSSGKKLQASEKVLNQVKNKHNHIQFHIHKCPVYN